MLAVQEEICGQRKRMAAYGYFVVSSEMCNRFLAEPDRFVEAAAFYRQLFREGELLQEFAPSSAHAGPTIRVYRVR